jgi:PAS domain S-box-containing protein
MAPEFLEKASRMIRAKLDGSPPTIYETEVIAKDGRRVPLEINTRLILEDGKPVGIQGIGRDTTERRRAEEELRKQRERLDKTAEATPVVICSLRRAADGFVTMPFASPAVLNVFGLDPEGLQESASGVFKRIHPEDMSDILRAMEQTSRELSLVHQVFRYDHPSRGEIWIEVHASPSMDPDGSVTWHGIAADITEQKLAEAALSMSEEQLRQAQKLESIGILAGGMAHDFNNMLTAINGYSDLILRKIDPDDPLRKNVEEIRKAGERSAELTRQLLAFSRRQILQPKVLNLNEVIEDTTSLVQRLIGEDIQVSTQLRSDLWNIQADPGQLSQVLMNLAINSRDAMPEGGSLLIETSNIVLDGDYAGRHIDVKAGRYVMLAVSDTGVGMDEDTTRRVFEPFFTTKTVGRGTGLGLSTVYGIVRQSGGNIWVYSEVGRGSTFKIYLPEAKTENSVEEPSDDQRELSLGSETILLVEDEETVRGLAREILEACGYSVIEASDGVDAIEKFEACEHVDLLMTDVVMPRMGGRELSEKLRQRCPAMRVLFTSGYTDDAILRHGITDQGTNFLQKPFTFESLAKKIRSLLDSE